MCLFNFRKENRIGKFATVLISLLCLAIGGGLIFGGIYAVLHMAHWSKFIIISVACLVALLFIGFGITLFVLSLSMLGSWKSTRDVNNVKGVAGTRLCPKCGRKIAKKATFCEHCGSKLNSGMKKCPNCKELNSANAEFCDKCGTKFEE